MADNYYKSGAWNVICQVCGFKYKNEEVQRRWDGLLVCKDDFETRHPSDFLKPHKEKIGVPYTAPEPTDTFITVTYVASTVGVQDSTIPAGTNHGDL